MNETRLGCQFQHIGLSTLIAAALTLGCSRSVDKTQPTTNPTTATSVTPAAPATAPRIVVREEVIPAKLWVTVYAHEASVEQGSISLWTFVSDGLWPLHQKEIVFSIKREPREGERDFPQELFELYSHFYDFAARGQFVDVHGRSRFSGKPLLGREDFHGVAYGHPTSFPGIEFPQPHIAGIIVTGDELDIAEKTGFTRLFTRLASRAHYFPTPFWTDRRRDVVSRKGDFDESFLVKMRRSFLSGAWILLERKGGMGTVVEKPFFRPTDKIVLRVLPRAVEALKKATADQEQSVTLLLEMDQNAGQALTWVPEIKTLQVNTCNGHPDNVTANFVTLIETEEREALGGAIEDGFVLGFFPAEWQTLRKALLAGEPIVIPARESRPEFRFEIAKTTYISPVDGQQYHFEYGMVKAEPSGGVVKTNPQVDTSLVLLTNQQEIAVRTTVEDMAGVAKAIRIAVESEIGDKPGPGSNLAVECEMTQGNPLRFRLAQQPTLDPAFKAAIDKKLGGIKAPQVSGPVKFQVIFKIRGGATPAP